jgi:glutaredoxin
MNRRAAMRNAIVALGFALVACTVQAQQGPAGQAPIRMYATSWCPYCAQARAYFARNGIAYTEFDIEKSQAGRAEFRSLGGRGIPVILVGDQRMDGFSEQRLAQMLKAAGY